MRRMLSWMGAGSIGLAIEAFSSVPLILVPLRPSASEGHPGAHLDGTIVDDHAKRTIGDEFDDLHPALHRRAVPCLVLALGDKPLVLVRKSVDRGALRDVIRSAPGASISISR